MNELGREEVVINVDFDGTLTKGKYHEWDDEEPEPRPEMVEWVRGKYYQGFVIIIWTARPWSAAQSIAAWLTKHGVPYYGIRCEKGASDMYVDDKAYRPLSGKL